MNYGEGTRENVSEVASPESYGADVSPASLSHYSSCGESEFERYCSANSVMGTPSVRSSFGVSFNDCVDFDFGSLKSLGFGDDLSFENFCLGGNRKLPTLGDRKIEFREGRNGEDLNMESGLYCDSNSNRNEGINDDGNMQINGSEMMMSDDEREFVGSGEGGERSLVSNEVGNGRDIEQRFDGREMEGEEDGTSSRYEDSEGEDSMYNYGSDEEHRGNSYYPRNVGFVQEAKGENENPLVINSHLAFGLNDWDDFEQGGGGSTLSSLTLEKFQERREPNLESGKNLLGFTSKSPIGLPSGGQKELVNDVKDAPVVSKKVQGADECEENINHSTATPGGAPNSGEQEHVEEEEDITVASYQVQGGDLLAENTNNLSPTPIGLPRLSGPHQDVREISVTCNQFEGTDVLEESTKSSLPNPSRLLKFSGPDQYARDVAASSEVRCAHDLTIDHNNGSSGDFFEVEHETLVETAPLKIGLDIVDSGIEKRHQNVNSKEVGTNESGVIENLEFGLFTAPLAEFSVDQLCSDSIKFPGKLNVEFFDGGDTFGNITNASKNSSPLADINEELPSSIKPMLCVSAVNPLLYSKVPALQHVMGVRKKIGSMIPFVRCPFRRSINKGLGSRRYLLESNDFFALRDLIDLSKGPFAALPLMVENVSKKILEHIMEQCLICCDVGVPCCAQQACDDPSYLIFAFQESEVERCKSCEAVFHKPCFKKLTCCPCGVNLGLESAVNPIIRASHNANAEATGPLNLPGNRAGSALSMGLLSGIFSKAKPDKTELRYSNNVIRMGSPPSTCM